jgi:hypothetical protein
MTDPGKSEVLQGTLDLMILKTLEALRPQSVCGTSGDDRVLDAGHNH